MPLISLDDISLRYCGPMLLDGISATVDAGARIGLLGRNGAGKSTLLKIIAGSVSADSGSVTVEQGARIGTLGQDVPSGLRGSVTEIVRRDLATAVDISEVWKVDLQVEETLQQMSLDGDAAFESLSVGMKRRVLLARELAAKPDLLLLDEPTNHLDLPSILWLEDFLRRWPGSFIFVTHDRAFLQSLADRIWEIEAGLLYDWTCDYQTFLKRKADKLAAEEKHHALFDKKLSEEEAWIRRGIKARRTRNEGRVRALQEMRRQRQQRREKVGTAKLQIQQAGRSGTLVVEAKEISFAYDGHSVIPPFSTTILRGDKIGIIGPNGAGKSTLLKLLLGELQPQSGSIRHGTNLQVAYFDQLRDTLDVEKSVQENVSDGNDSVLIGGRTRHILGYLQDFLFTPERARTAVKFLSGGERNRVLLARLMTRPANIIVLDEPTNDLDSETLDLLEEQLIDFAGTILLVSHDRTFLNNVVTGTIVFEREGLNEYVGGYDDWVAAVQRRTGEEASAPLRRGPKSKPPPATAAASSSSAGASRMSYKDKYELEQLPERIEQLESEIAGLHSEMADPVFYKQSGEAIAAAQSALQSLEQQLSDSYRRWEELEEFASRQ